MKRSACVLLLAPLAACSEPVVVPQEHLHPTRASCEVSTNYDDKGCRYQSYSSGGGAGWYPYYIYYMMWQNHSAAAVNSAVVARNAAFAGRSVAARGGFGVTAVSGAGG